MITSAMRTAARLCVLSWFLSLPNQPAAGQPVAERTITHQHQLAQLSSRLAAFGKVAAAVDSQLEEKVTYVWDDEWTNDTRTLYDYDETGRTAAWEYVWNGSEWVESAVTRTMPEGAGYSMILREEYDAEAETWHPVERTQTDFVEDPQSGDSYINWILYQTWDGEDWVNVERDTYSYDGSFEATLMATEVWDGDAWAPSGRTLVSEEESNVVMLNQDWDGADWVNAERLIYRDRTIKQLVRDLMKMGSEMDDYEDVFYGIHLLPAFEVQEWNGAEWENVSRQVRTYDLMTGDVVEHITELWEEGAWVPSIRIFVEYESAGVVSAMSYEFFTGDSWFTFVREEYTRDDQGSIVEAVQQTDLGTGLSNTGRVTFEWDHLSTGAEDEQPFQIALDPAYPNPFNPETHLSFRLGTSGYVTLQVYDALGRLVASLVDEVRSAGEHDVTFEAAHLPSGHYIIRLRAPGFVQTRTVTLLK